MTRGQIISLEVRNEIHYDLILRAATIWKRPGSIEMRIGHPVRTPMVWCLMSHLIGNVVNEAEVEMKATQESVVEDDQNLLFRGQEETIAKEDQGAGAERDVLVVKGDPNRALSAVHCLIRSYRFSVRSARFLLNIYINIYNCAHWSPFPSSATHVSLGLSIRLSRR